MAIIGMRIVPNPNPEKKEISEANVLLEENQDEILAQNEELEKQVAELKDMTFCDSKVLSSRAP